MYQIMYTQGANEYTQDIFFVTHMFSKDHQSIKLLGQSKDKPRVVHEIVDWSLISSVEE